MSFELVHSSALQLPLLLSVFTASILGSLHCVGMCGPFVAVYSMAEQGSKGDSSAHSGGRQELPLWLAHSAYHGGRALSYMLVGALGGIFGSFVDWAGEFAGLSQVAAILSSVLLVLWGLGVLFPRLSIKSPFTALLGRQLVRLRTKPRILRASILGAVAPLLPCAWFYAFALTAAGTGSAWRGALVMFVFWSGTVPALLGMGALVGRFGKSLRARVPLLTGSLLIVVGLLGVVSRMSRPLDLQAGAQRVDTKAAGQTLGFDPEAAKCH